MTTEEDHRPDEPAPAPAADLLAGAFLLALSAFVMAEAARMPPRGPLGFFTGPSLVPMLLGVALAVLSATLLSQSLRQGAVRALPRLIETLHTTESIRIGVLTVLLGLLVVLIGRVPFWAANLVYFVLTFAYLRVGGGRLVPVLLYAGLFTLLVGVLLPRAFEVPMP
jgi:hypothetical protein